MYKIAKMLNLNCKPPPPCTNFTRNLLKYIKLKQKQKLFFVYRKYNIVETSMHLK